jgi:hypothetical protein
MLQYISKQHPRSDEKLVQDAFQQDQSRASLVELDRVTLPVLFIIGGLGHEMVETAAVETVEVRQCIMLVLNADRTFLSDGCDPSASLVQEVTEIVRCRWRVDSLKGFDVEYGVLCVEI